MVLCAVIRKIVLVW